MNNTIQPIAIQQNEDKSRAKEIDHGTIPLSMTNAILGLPQKPGLNKDDQSSVSAPKWSYDQLVGQKKLLTTLTINSSTNKDFGNKPVFVFQNTWRNIWKIHFNSLNSIFLFKSWRVNFAFQFRSNFQQVGMMALSYSNYPVDSIPYLINKQQSVVYTLDPKYDQNTCVYPWLQDVYEVTELDDMRAIYQLPHTLVFMGEDQDVNVSLEWLSPFKASIDSWNPKKDFNPKNAIPGKVGPTTFNNDYDMGTLRLHVPVPMRVSTGVIDKLTVRVYTWLDNLEYSGYVPTDTL